jgi:hypothetical protein
MTMHEIADALDELAATIRQAHMPSADDPRAAEKFYVLDNAVHAITQRAAALRNLTPPDRQ